MNTPIRWTLDQLTADARRAKEIFRQERREETRDAYVRHYAAVAPIFRDLIEALRPLAKGHLPVGALVDTPLKFAAFRYLAAPPVSADDLSTLTDVVVNARLSSRTEDAATLLGTMMDIIDPHRFPWIIEDREPSAHEIDAAVIASAAMLASQQVMTGRRTMATADQERAVKQVLIGAGYVERPRRRVAMLHQAPEPREFCGESMLGSTRADFVVVLPDRRVLAIECKASNSAVNSFKRVNHEALGKATKWREAFGAVQVIPAAVLSGVFSPANLEAAQEGGLALFWQFRLSDLAAFVG